MTFLALLKEGACEQRKKTSGSSASQFQAASCLQGPAISTSVEGKRRVPGEGEASLGEDKQGVLVQQGNPPGEVFSYQMLESIQPFHIDLCPWGIPPGVALISARKNLGHAVYPAPRRKAQCRISRGLRALREKSVAAHLKSGGKTHRSRTQLGEEALYP